MKATHILSSAVLIALFTMPVMAQDGPSIESQPDSFWRVLEYQVATSLTSDIEDVKLAQMKNAIAMSTLYRHRVDLSHGVAAIIAYHKSCDDPQRRALAVAALQSIDSAEGRRYLRKNVKAGEMEAARVEMMAVLTAYTAGAPVARL